MTPAPIRVLVVDDDPGVRYTLREILESEGLAVDEAADGAEALARFEARPAPLVVTDLRMPGGRRDGAPPPPRRRARPRRAWSSSPPTARSGRRSRR